MTVKEFASKYGIDYTTVYNATWLAKPEEHSLRNNKQYNEEDLRAAVQTTMLNKMNRLMRELAKAEAILKRVSL